MCGFVKGAVRFGVITLIGTGAAMLVAEGVRPGSVQAIAGQASSAIAGVIDNNIDDPVALRAQLASLEAEYPQRISELRSDLLEAQDQIGQLERELAVSDKVVQLTSHDLETLDLDIARARSTQDTSPHAVVRVSFDDRRLSLQDAYTKRSQIERTRVVYQTRGEDIAAELGHLETQQEQIAELLTRLETEQAQFQAQIVQLDAQIDAIERGDRMLAMMEERQQTIDEHSRYRAASLDHLTGRLERVRAEQQSRLAAISGNERNRNYVDEAEFLLDTETPAASTPDADPEWNSAGGDALPTGRASRN